MTTVEASTLVALVIGPLLAVWVTIGHETRKEKIGAQRQLFLTLMVGRQAFPIPPEWARALNVIDAVYADHSAVITAWHDMFAYMNRPPMDTVEFDRKRTKLLSEMAKALGYTSLEQVDIARYYTPEQHNNDAIRAIELQTELLALLKKLNQGIDQLKASQLAQAVHAAATRQS